MYEGNTVTIASVSLHIEGDPADLRATGHFLSKGLCCPLKSFLNETTPNPEVDSGYEPGSRRRPCLLGGGGGREKARTCRSAWPYTPTHGVSALLD